MTTPKPEQVIERTVEEVKQSPEDFIDTENFIRYYFADIPELIDVAFCESTFRQTDANGIVVRGRVNRSDVGVMQINEHYHEKDATALGLDLETIEGNVAFARHLYEKKGLSPWKHSKPCWSARLVKLAMK